MGSSLGLIRHMVPSKAPTPALPPNTGTHGNCQGGTGEPGRSHHQPPSIPPGPLTRQPPMRPMRSPSQLLRVQLLPPTGPRGPAGSLAGFQAIRAAGEQFPI